MYRVVRIEIDGVGSVWSFGVVRVSMIGERWDILPTLGACFDSRVDGKLTIRIRRALLLLLPVCVGSAKCLQL